MRKPRDYDAEMKALADKARQLKSRKQSQLGELVIATDADALSMEELAGALLAAATADAATKEGWRKGGAAFFRGTGPHARSSSGDKPGSAAAGDSGAQPAAAGPGAA